MEPKVVHRIPKPPPPTGETGRRLQAQARRCAAGDHAYAWTGQIVEVPDGSRHLVMACAYGAIHDKRSPSPRLIGPPLTPENITKRVWTKAELEQAARRHET